MTERLGKLQDHYDSGMIVCVADDYAEPGYSKDRDDLPIVTGDWNPTRFRGDPEGFEHSVGSRLAAVLERCGYTLEWLDEWAECQHCWRLVRTQPDSYSWRPYYLWLEDVVCGDCVRENPEWVLDELVDDDNRADTLVLDLPSLGFEQVNGTFESGWHPGQDDNPRELGPRLTPEGYERIWQIPSVGQFDVRFTLWIRKVEDR